MIKTIAAKFSALYSASANLACDITNGRDFGENLRLVKESGLFDLAFYLGQLDEPNLNLNAAIAHYLNTGAANFLDPHPLFDTAFYVQTNEDINFSDINPFVHFLVKGWTEGRNPHALFDVTYYLDEYEDVRRSNDNPLVHYVHFGAGEKRDPSPIFDPAKYRKKVQEADLRKYFKDYLKTGHKLNFLRWFKTTRIQRASALRSYLAPYFASGRTINFLRRFKNKRTKRIIPSLKRDENPILHFLTSGGKRRIFPFPNFELLFKLEARRTNDLPDNKAAKFLRVVPRDLVNDKSTPERFSSFVSQLGKGRLSKEQYALFKEMVHAFTFKKNAHEFMQSENCVILLSHQASLTGAPLLLLQLARELSERGWECLLILERGGELEAEFSEVAHVLNLYGLPGRHKKCSKYLSLLFDELRFKRPKVCLLNSLEMGLYTKPMQENGIQIISLVHEIVDTYSTVFLEDVFECSKAVVFPANFVRNFALKRIGSGIRCSRELVIPNALLENNFGAYSKEEGRVRLRQEINVSDDALIVLGCGSPDMRKGIDLFVTLAKIIMFKWKHYRDRPPVHFVWIGADKIDPFTAHYYVNWDLVQGNLQSHIHFLPSRKDLRPAFRGADVFVLPSRKDPFPCVVHNAMAAELPIVTFRGAGGVPEMVEGGGAKVIDYGDILAFAEAVEEYLLNEELRLNDGLLNAKVVVERFRFNEYVSQIENEMIALVQK